MGKDSGTAATRPCALAPPALSLALAAMLFLALTASAEAGQTPARVDEVVNVRAGRGLDTPRVLRLAPGEQVLAGDCRNDWCAVSRPGAADQLLGYVFAPLLRPQAGSLPVANPVSGTEFTLVPAVRVDETYDSNVMFQDISDQETRLSPVLEGRLRAEHTTVNLRALAEVLRYARFGEFDRMNRELNLGLSHNPTELSRLELRGRARSDHTFESALAESGTVVEQNPRHEYSLQPALAYQLGERTEVRLSGAAAANLYANNRENDVQSRGGSLGLTRVLDADASSLQARAGFTSDSYDSGRQDTATLAAGLDRKLTDTLSCLLLAGPSLSRDRFSGPDGGESHLGLAGEGWIRMKLEQVDAELGGDMGTVPGSNGEDNLRRRLLAKAVYHLSQRLDLALAGTWFRSRTRGQVREQDNTVLNLAPSLDYDLGEHSGLRLGYDYTCIDDHVGEVYRQRHRISLSLYFEFPRRLR